jgi:hypothetical protein
MGELGGTITFQVRNNYHKGTAGVFNGTVGTVTALSITDQQVTVRTDEDEDIGYDFDELDELQHAYAITVHRSQGSEYPGRGRPTDYELLRAATAKPALHRHHPGQRNWWCSPAAVKPWPSRSAPPAPAAGTPP